jgi:hypothetical protein
MEQHDVYALADLTQPLDADVRGHARLRATSIPTFVCPSRRAARVLTRDGASAVGDYVSVSRADALPGVVLPSDPRTWDGAMLVSRAFNRTGGDVEMALDGKTVALKPGQFRSRTTFADVIDGLSNAAFLGEKAVHQDRLGGHATKPVLTAGAAEQDGPYYYGRGPHTPAELKSPGVLAYWSRRLAPARPGERLLAVNPRTADPENRFGSWHPGVSAFLLGDGSVRPVNHATSTIALQRLGGRKDRLPYDLP